MTPILHLRNAKGQMVKIMFTEYLQFSIRELHEDLIEGFGSTRICHMLSHLEFETGIPLAPLAKQPVGVQRWARAISAHMPKDVKLFLN